MVSKQSAKQGQQEASTHPQPIRPRFALRVGVTGTRAMPADDGALKRIEGGIRAALEALRDQAEEIAKKPEIANLHEHGKEPLLRLVSPLAEGADRLVAKIAIELGYQLEVPMPFPQAEYERDFQPNDRDHATNAASLAEFHSLLNHARPCVASDPRPVLELDGRRGDDEAASYGAVGRLVVRNCDLLIAVWNGRPGKGSGGTADTVRFAARGGRPIWWVDAEGKAQPRWVEGLAALRRPAALPSGSETLNELRSYFEGMVTPPQSALVPGEGLLGRLFRRHAAPLQRFLGERLPLGHAAIDWLWRSERKVMGLAQRAGERLEHWLGGAHRRIGGTGHSAPEAKPMSTSRAVLPEALPGAGAAAYWNRFYAAPDGLATAYAARYRSSYAIIAVLAALAVMAGNLAVVWGGSAKLPLTLLEFAALALLIWLVAANQRRHWHGRWIAYRLLAELCRMQKALAMLGWSLPLGDTLRAARGVQGTVHRRSSTAPEEPNGWVGWYFHAALRAAPMPSGTLAGAALNATRQEVSSTLLEEQIAYHEEKARDRRAQSRGLAGWGEVLLLLTAVLVFLKVLLLVLVGPWALGLAKGLGIAAMVIAVPSAAFIALRAYAELEVLADGHAAMAGMMRAVRDHLAALHVPEDGQPGLALVSQEIGGAVHAVAIDMLEETEGWARLFRVKGVEAA
jgi:hypothetical protein